MRKIQSSNSEYRENRKVFIYHTRNMTPLGRAMVYVFALLLLAAALFFSLVFFAILLTAALFFFVYTVWLARQINSRKNTDQSFEVESDDSRG